VKTLNFAAVVVLLSGCATQPARNYPTHDTAVVRKYVHNLGFKGFFASEAMQTVSTRADMRRAEDQFSFSGFLMKHLAKARDTARIWRVDRNLRWDLKLVDKTYTECPLTGCVSTRPLPEGRPEQAPAPERPQRKPSCALTLSKNKFSVKATGQTREINGFNTSEYEIAWDIVAQDKDKNKSTSALTVDVWTTPEDDPRIKAVQAVDRQFEAALRAQKTEEPRPNKFVPAEAMRIVDLEFMSAFSAEQRPSLTNAAKELAKIRGYPISTVLNWYLGGDACQAAPAPQENKAASSSGLDLTHGLGGLLGGVAGMGANAAAQKQVSEAAGKPVFGFVEEVREMNVEPASDGLFVPPANFKLTARN
jgi:hypothetical protein